MSVHVQALDAVKALGDGISPEAAAAYALGFVAGTKCSGTGMQVSIRCNQHESL